MTKKKLIYNVEQFNKSFLIYNHEYKFIIKSNESIKKLKSHDFAAWLLLPLGMVTGKDIVILGKGGESTEQNARRLSEAWHFYYPQK